MKRKNIQKYTKGNTIYIISIWMFISLVTNHAFAQNKGAESALSGKKIYEKRCMPCHGKDGKGDGPASLYLDPRPRDFTTGLYKLVSVEDGSIAQDEDIFKAISEGMNGTSMPGWKGIISEEGRRQLVAYLKTFSLKFSPNESPSPLEIENPIPSSPDSITKGKELFNENCDRCHGVNGRGNGEEALKKYKKGKFKDKSGNPIWPRDLTAGWKYRGGFSPKDIYKRISSGIPGTPMPTFDDLSEEERWHIANYVNSIAGDGKSTGSTVLKASFIEGELPLDPNAPIWSSVPPLKIPLSGQIMVYPRLLNRSVDMVTVRTIFNDKEVAFLLEYNDRIKDVVHTPSTPPATSKDKHETTYPVLYPPSLRTQDRLRDEAVIQFPVKKPEGPKKPFFFLGNSGNAVNLWSFKADWQEDSSKKSPVEELKATGYKALPVPHAEKSQIVEGKGSFDDGQWRVVMKRSLKSEDSSNDVIFERGKLIPVSFQIMDGKNGERGLQRAISSWYYLLLEAPVSSTLYIKALIGIIFGIGLEFWLIRAARRSKERE